MSAPACARCGGETRVRSQFPDTFLCRAGKRDKTCGFWWGRRRDNANDGPFFMATITTCRGYVHWPHGPASWSSSMNRVICIVRPKGAGWPTGETVYDMASIYLPGYDEPDSMYGQGTKDRALAIVAALREQGRVA